MSPDTRDNVPICGESDHVDSKRPRKKMGYIVTTMTTTVASISHDHSNGNDKLSCDTCSQGEDTSCIHSVSYPSFKGIYLAEEYRNHILSPAEGGHMMPLSQAMMSIYYKFLAHLYYTSLDHFASSTCVVDTVPKDTAGIPNVTFRTGCVMRKVLVCKLLTSQGWLPIHSSKGLEVTVLPRERKAETKLQSDGYHCTAGTTIPVNRAAASTSTSTSSSVIRISSPDLSIEVMRSKLFSLRTCQSQNIQLLSWEEAINFQDKQQEQYHQYQHQHQGKHDSTEESEEIRRHSIATGTVTTVNVEYSIDLDDLLVLVSESNKSLALADGKFSYEE
jgi:hypothetical protein